MGAITKVTNGLRLIKNSCVNKLKGGETMGFEQQEQSVILQIYQDNV